MGSILERITDWLKEMLVSAIMSNLTGLFDSVNTQVDSIAAEVGMSPANFSPEIFSLIRSLSETVILPIAGVILTFVCTWELIQIILSRNNLADFDFWIFFQWIFKTAIAVLLISHCFDITMAVFELAQRVINASGSLISASTAVDDTMLETLEETLMEMNLGPLLGVLIQSFVINLTMVALSIVIFVIIYGRMIEIYLMTSLAPIPFATFGSREQNQIGQNYLRSLLALGFQGFLILVCVGIYAVLIQTVTISENVIMSLWGIVGYTVLLVFTLFKTGSLSKSIFAAH